MIKGHFTSSVEGKIFVTQFGEVSSDTAILCLPPLFEELNLSRAVLAKQAQYFAKHDYPCFVMDYTGTGDSEGEIEHANTDIWYQDILATAKLMQSFGIKNIILWGIRFGGLLILHFQKELHAELAIERQLLWKPILKGKQFMTQFIRLKQANSMMKNEAVKTNWRKYIEEGNSTEIAGYLVTPGLLNNIDGLNPDLGKQPLSKVSWVEYAANSISPLIANFTNAWPQETYRIECLESAAFWQVPEFFELAKYHQNNLLLLRD